MVDYSRWDNIEVSDDEDDTHPNIDTPSLFRWRHQARLDREAEAKKEKDAVTSQSLQTKTKIEKTRKRLEELKTTGEPQKENIVKVEEELHTLEEQNQKWREKEEELVKKDKMTPWNVDTLSKDGFSSTSINKPKAEENLSEEEQEKRQAAFIRQHEKNIKKYGMYKKWDDTGAFLLDHPELVCEGTANYLVIWAIDLQVDKKEALMEQVAHQVIVMQFMLELARNLKCDPRSCIRPFFSKIKCNDKQYMESFTEELNLFKGRVRQKAQDRIDRAMKEAEEEMEKDRQARLGPGGLDPVEVFETLPAELKACFESKDISMLQKVIGTMESADAEYHIKRCVDSGLWVPGGDGGKDPGGDTTGEETTGGDTKEVDGGGEEVNSEPTYESV